MASVVIIARNYWMSISKDIINQTNIIMSKAIEDNLRNCVKFYSQAIENEIRHPDEEVYAEQESRAFTMLYDAIKDDVMEKFAQEILDNLHGALPF